MVRSSISPSERRYWTRVLKLLFVFVVALSAALIAVQADATPAEIGLVSLVGGVFGVALLRYLTWMDVSWTEQRQRRR